MESSTLLEFDPRFPKMCAGIGTFLERDTLSRSLVIQMERYLLAESRKVKEYLHCTDDVTLPIYRAFLKYWTDEHKAIFGLKCRTVIHQFPEEFRSRRRLKFVPLLALAEMGGPALYEEVMEAAKWMHNAPDSGSATLTHQLLCDVARCVYRQVLLLHLKVLDPITKKPSAAVRQSETDCCVIPTTKLIELLHLLPEAPWKSYGREKRTLNANGLFEMLAAYGLEAIQQKIDGVRYRGLIYKLFHEKYRRYCRIGDPTLKSIAEELNRDLESPDGPSGGASTPPSKDPQTPSSGGNESSPQKNDKSSGTGGTAETSASTPMACSVPAVFKDIESRESAGTEQVVDSETFTPAVPAVPALFSISAACPLFVPPSTPAAGFCVPTNPERKIGVDLETFYPWPSEGEITAQEPRRRKDGKAHPYAKDPRRNAIRLLTLHTGTEVRVFDLFTESVPDDVRDLLRNSTLIIHNADFDLMVLAGTASRSFLDLRYPVSQPAPLTW